MNQPTFWLQVRSEYIIENFENLISYLKAYTYLGTEADNPDYITTIDCMSDLCRRYADDIFQTPFYSRPEIIVGTTMAVRLFAATILAAHKAGRTPHRETLALIDLLLKNGVACKASIPEGISRVIVSCLRGQKLRSAVFSWELIDKIASNFDLLFVQLSQMKFEAAPPKVWSIVENCGTLAIPPSGLPFLAAMNRVDLEHTSVETLFGIPGILDVTVNKKTFKRYADYTKFDEYTRDILKSIEGIRPSPVTKLNTYSRHDCVMVRIIEKTGIKIVAETIDPAFVTVRGNLWIKTVGDRPDANVVRRSIQVGDYLEVTYNDDGNTKFSIEENLEYFYRQYAATFANKKFWAVYVRDYSAGMEFVSSEGIHFGVDRSKFAILSDEDAEIVEKRKQLGYPVRLQAYREAPDVGATRFTIYAEFVVDDLDEYIADNEMFSRESAEFALMDVFKDDCATEAEDILTSVPDISYRRIDPALCTPLLTLLYRNIDYMSGSSIERLKFYTAIAMTARILERGDEEQYIAYCRRLLDAEVRFARNEPIVLPEVPASLGDVEELVHRHKTIGILTRYRHPDFESDEQKIVAEDSQKRITALVEASNNLIGILDNAELNTIKQFISRALNVEDQYESILDQRTFYGTESICLEFKSSAVYPPSNMRRHASTNADPEMQKWNILKAVCGFLNSRSGGELLIGVRDTGYACGIRDDIETLYRLGRIDFATADRYRNYIQLMIDRAYKVKGKNIDSKDITMINVDCQIEENEEGQTILRVKVKPYADGLVEVADTDRPEGVEKSYLRLSGRTVPVSKAVATQILAYKK